MAKKAATPKPEKVKKPKAPKAKKAAAPDPKPIPRVSVGHNLGIDPEKRELFLSDLRKWEALDKAAKSAAGKRRAFEKTIKADGFLMAQITLASKLSTPEGEEEFRQETANLLIAAQYVGAAIGQQLSLFLEPDRTPAVDTAYDLGTQEAMEGKTCKPPYDPSTAQAASYIKGWQDEQDRRMAKGFKKLETADEPSRADTLAAARAANEVEAPPPEKMN